LRLKLRIWAFASSKDLLDQRDNATHALGDYYAELNEEVKRFLEITPFVEKTVVGSRVILLKYWLEISMGEQKRRLASRIDDGRKLWKLSPMDLLSYCH
jgi:polyphosphate kinase 2 (PPK2 family)